MRAGTRKKALLAALLVAGCSPDDLAKALDEGSKRGATLYEIDLKTGDMKERAAPASPFGLRGPAFTAAGGKLVYIGADKAAEIYDPAADRWAATPPLSGAFEDLLTAVVGSKVYAGFGLKDGLAYNDFEVIDAGTGAAEKLPNFPEDSGLPRALFAVNDRIVAFAGGSIFAYDIAGKSWGKQGAEPAPFCQKTDDAAAVVGAKIVFSACRKDSAARTQPQFAVLYDPASGEVTEHQGPELTADDRGFFGFTRFYPGGFLLSDPQEKIHRFDVKALAWSELPPPPELSGAGGAGVAEGASVGQDFWLYKSWVEGESKAGFYRLDLSSGSWQKLGGALLAERLIVVSVEPQIVGEKLYLLGER